MIDIIFKILGVSLCLLLLLQIPLELRRKPARMTRVEFDDCAQEHELERTKERHDLPC